MSHQSSQLPDLTCVINWLENGCDPKEAAKELRIYRDIIASVKRDPLSEPNGWKLVPEIPTEAMNTAGYLAGDKWTNAECDNRRELHMSFSEPRYMAMLKAAPPPPPVTATTASREEK